ncbi:hypothetical protein AB9F26_05060 [Falsihalocynthiibacter sp. BN13B15]|uniref:hypothetical protein n=1 Tax=Falsihalocynthiibacter sp. BN13B15 TaxID=3240871 RepID=UPI0035106211
MIDLEHIQTCIGSLQMRTEEERPSHFASWVVEQGGTWPIMPRGVAHLVEVQLFEITGLGTSPIEAIRDWMKCASRRIETAEKLNTARNALRLPDIISDADIATHCEILKSLGTPEDSHLARQLLAAIGKHKKPQPTHA